MKKMIALVIVLICMTAQCCADEIPIIEWDRTPVAPTQSATPAAPTPTPVSETVFTYFYKGDILGAANFCISTMGSVSGSNQNNLAFLIRYGHLKNNDLNSDELYEVPTLLASGVKYGNEYAIINMALYEMENGHYFHAYELLADLSEEQWANLVDQFWYPSLWLNKDAEGALVCALANKYGNYPLEDATEITASVQANYPDIYRRFIQTYPIDVTLKKGDSGSYVFELQKTLIEHNYLDDVVTGSFDEKTQDAVKAVQKAAGYDQTGIADMKTIDFLVRHITAFNATEQYGVVFYAAYIDKPSGNLRLAYKNMGKIIISGVEWEIGVETKDRERLGSLFDRSETSLTQVSTSALRKTGECNEAVLDINNGTIYPMADGTSATASIPDDAAYININLLEMTLANGESYPVNQRVYCKIK